MTYILYKQFYIEFYKCFFRCTDKGVDPVPCLKTTYSPSGQMSCTTCPKGGQCPTDKLQNYIPCSTGTYSDTLGKETCISCPAGSKCPDAIGPAVVCGDGYYSKGGTADCTICPNGYR